MSKIRIKSIKVQNYRSFGNELQEFYFPDETHKKPVAIVGYNNSGKTNLMNCIRYGIGLKYVSEDAFLKTDLHQLKYENNIHIEIDCDSSSYGSYQGRDKKIGTHTVSTKIDDDEIRASVLPNMYGATKHYSIFYINFHEIKEEISTQRTNWGALKSFLSKHINKLINEDKVLKDRKKRFAKEITAATDKVLIGDQECEHPEPESDLSKFIKKIQTYYEQNLRDSSCKIDFSLPDYEDIFLQMLFKIGLNGNHDKLVPIDHFGDGYISMFVMAVIQAIAESDSGDECLFLFEEPESFLHENHQEYFYKTVLCGLAKKRHQVIYTTHSHRMVDMFDTQGLIRIEYDEVKCQTVVKYNDSDDLLELDDFNSFIKSIDPSLNKILFSKKVVLVEGPNDLMTYNYIIKHKVLEKIKDREDILDKENYAETYLNFKNIAIVPHHGKHTVYSLIELCKKIELDYFVITDWDLDSVSIGDVNTLTQLEDSDVYKRLTPNQKGQLTTNVKILRQCEETKYHFNYPKLEALIGNGEDFGKDSKLLWGMLNTTTFDEKIFPNSLSRFLEIDELESTKSKDSKNSDEILAV